MTRAQVLPMLQRLEVDIGASVIDSSPLRASSSGALPPLRITASCCVFVPEVGYILADACGALWVVHAMTLAVVSHRLVGVVVVVVIKFTK